MGQDNEAAVRAFGKLATASGRRYAVASVTSSRFGVVAWCGSWRLVRSAHGYRIEVRMRSGRRGYPIGDRWRSGGELVDACREARPGIAKAGGRLRVVQSVVA